MIAAVCGWLEHAEGDGGTRGRETSRPTFGSSVTQSHAFWLPLTLERETTWGRHSDTTVYLTEKGSLGAMGRKLGIPRY